DLLVGVLEAVDQAGRGRTPQLNVVHERLGAAVALLAVDLGGVCGAVQLEVELAVPHGRLGIVLAGTVEQVTRCGPLDLGRAVEVREALLRGEHLAGGAAAAVAPAGRGETDVAGALVLEVLLEVRE